MWLKGSLWWSIQADGRMWRQTRAPLLWTLVSLALSCGGHTNRCWDTFLCLFSAGGLVWSLVRLHSDQPSWKFHALHPQTAHSPCTDRLRHTVHRTWLKSPVPVCLAAWCYEMLWHQGFTSSQMSFMNFFDGELIIGLVWQVSGIKSMGSS